MSPTAALVAVTAIGLGLSLYATAFAGAVPTTHRDVATPTLSAVHDVVAPAGVAAPGEVAPSTSVGPDGWELYVELRAGDRRWSAGPAPKPTAESRAADRRVPIRISPGQVRSGWLRVVIHR
ncbi:DUF7285 family protein [Halolamina litorea]|uniref:DUF7285 family protein n=1 Tax=Halolamina litorea TaxID=1515593 RepID=UPI00226D7FEE|nr:hypothetical protein [Halolamina litorea]